MQKLSLDAIMVLHRRMRRAIQQPRILMLASALEFQRNPHRLASFDHYSKDQVRMCWCHDVGAAQHAVDVQR